MVKFIRNIFKMFFSNRFFTIILMLIMFFASSTFTLLNSSYKAFNQSYEQIKINGNLHDYTVKSFFNNEGTFDLKFQTFGEPIEVADEYEIKFKILVHNPKEDYLHFFESNNWKKVSNHLFEYREISFIGQDKDAKEPDQKTIDKIKSEIINLVLDNKPKAFVSAIQDIYKDKLNIKHTQSISIFDKNKEGFLRGVNNVAYDLEKTSQENELINDAINKIIIYDGTKKFTSPLANQEFLKNLSEQIDLDNLDFNEFILDKSKKYVWTVEGLTKSFSIVDPSSYQTIVSPSYANSNNKRAISPQKVLNIYRETNYFKDFLPNSKFAKKYEESILWVDKIPFFIIGIGASLDFAFPISSQSRPIPSLEKDGIFFLNERGYARIEDSFGKANGENYFSLKYKPNISQKEKVLINNEITDIALKGKNSKYVKNNFYDKFIPKINLPKGVRLIVDSFDTSDNFVLSGQRTLFLEEIQKMVYLFSASIIIFLSLYLVSIIVLVFKILINLKKKEYATLLALGHSRVKIAASFSSLTLILIGLPSISGYLLGHFLQFPFINIFANHWTLPIFGSGISFLSLMFIFLFPLAILFTIIFSIIYFSLNKPVRTMLNENSNIHISRFKKIFSFFAFTKKSKKVNPKRKYTISLMSTNIGRLTLSGIIGIFTLVAVVSGVSSINKAQYAFDATSKSVNYGFKVDLKSPNYAMDNSYKKINYLDAIELLETKNIYNNENNDQVQWFIPKISDAKFANPTKDIVNNSKDVEILKNFLKNKIQFKPLIDVSFANGIINTWNIAEKSIPDNQRNQILENENLFYKTAVDYVDKLPNTSKEKRDWQSKSWFPKLDKEKQIYYVDAKEKIVNNQMDQNFVHFVKKILKNNQHFAPFLLTYNLIILDQKDQTYSGINIDFRNKQFNVVGIDPQSNFFNLSKEMRDKIQNPLEENIYPILINQFIKERYWLNINDVIDVNLIEETTFALSKNKFKIVGIIDSYDNSSWITSKENIDKILNIKDKDFFNGVLLHKNSKTFLNSLQFLSDSNLYLPTNSVLKDQWSSIIQEFIKDPKLNVKDVQEFVNAYGENPYSSITKYVFWVDINRQVFKNSSDLFSSLIKIMQLIFIFLSILFSLIISNLIINANKKKIATLITLGYSKKEIIKIFASIYILPIILVILFGFPLALASLTMIKMVVMTFGSILIPFNITILAAIVSLGIIIFIFIFSIMFEILKTNNKEVQEKIKE